MKTSNKLLIILLTAVLLALVGSNMVLKAQYDKINFQDPFYGYTRQNLPAFQHVRLRGGYFGLVQLQQGDKTQIQIQEAAKENIQWQINGDTLILSVTTGEGPFFYRTGDAFTAAPLVYLTAPTLSSVQSAGVTCKLTGWQTGDWLLQQEGAKSGMLLENNTLKRVQAVAKGGSLFQVGNQNHMETLIIQANDSSSVLAEQSVAPSIQLRTDSTTRVTLSGSLFNQLTQ